MRRSWLRALILGAMIGSPPAAAEPAEVEEAPPEPEQVFQGIGAELWGEHPRQAAEWASALLRTGGQTLDAAGWRSIAATTAVLPPLLTDELEAQLTAWGSVSERSDLSPLGCLLCLLPSLDRTTVVSSWATSPDEQTRRALARALSAPFEAVGVRGALEHLQRDPSAEVRRLARSAATLRAPSA